MCKGSPTSCDIFRELCRLQVECLIKRVHNKAKKRVRRRGQGSVKWESSGILKLLHMQGPHWVKDCPQKNSPNATHMVQEEKKEIVRATLLQFFIVLKVEREVPIQSGPVYMTVTLNGKKARILVLHINLCPTNRQPR
ncbi:hypothetical protein AMTR_s00065p00192850 [Amborella trichopoda]|uniref:Uncharacterized protein n=1 Tax=Amborella trichopoda TaxID=13333 RepID=U5DE28_AMBTC|nr:hypothetical protein AMTR_s00065p00192850 [Amborella trichopoda]